MGAVQTRLVQMSLAKQAAKGTPAVAPAYTVGLTGGKVYDVELTESDLDTTWDNRVLSGFDREQAIPVSDASLVAMPKSIGLLLNLALGAVATTGAASVYTHVFTVGQSLPYATVWGKIGSAGDAAQLSDAKLESLEFEWDKAGACKVKAKFIGCDIDTTVDFPVVGATAEVVSSGVLKGVGGSFQIDGAAARVTGGSIKITNTLETIVTSDSITPSDVFEGKVGIEVSLKVKPDDLSTWRKVITGTANGSGINAQPFYGSFDIGFVGPNATSLDFAASKAAWSTNLPDADPNGGAAELTLAGRLVIPATGSPITATLVNDVATY